MKKTSNFGSIYFFLTVGASLLFNGGVFAGHKEGISPSKGAMGTIKLSGKFPKTHSEGKSSILRQSGPKHLEQVSWNRTLQKADR
jgi:hypothetical protein